MMMTLGLKSFFHAEALTDIIRILDNLDIIIYYTGVLDLAIKESYL